MQRVQNSTCSKSSYVHLFGSRQPDIESYANGAFRHVNDHDQKIMCYSSREAEFSLRPAIRKKWTSSVQMVINDTQIWSHTHMGGDGSWRDKNGHRLTRSKIMCTGGQKRADGRSEQKQPISVKKFGNDTQTWNHMQTGGDGRWRDENGRG
jgi:hypothetical protein